MDELIDVCDENNKLLGINKMKSDVHKDGLWHRASHIWVHKDNGEVLLQLRAKSKDLYPSMWDTSAAGHVNLGEDPLISGMRETEEELGLKAEKEDFEFFKILKHKAIYKNLKNNEFYYIYFLRFNGDISSLKKQDEEVDDIKFVPIEEIEEELKTNPEKFVPHGPYWFDVLDEIKKKVNV